MALMIHIPAWAAAPIAGGVAAVAVAGGIAWHLATSEPELPPARDLPVALPAKPAANPAQVGQPGANAAPPPPIPPLTAPAFDIVRVEPSGEVLVAGRGLPGASVTVMAQGKPIASGTVDSGGQFVLLPPALDAGDHLLSLQMVPSGQPPVDSGQSVAVHVAPKTAGGVVVALAEPGKPTSVLSDPPATRSQPATATVPIANPDVVIRTVDAEQGGGFFVTGLAKAGANVRLYLNGTYIAAMQASDFGRWSLKIDRGMQPGHYAVRADQVEAGSANVVARAEVPFDYPTPAWPKQAAPPAKPAAEAEIAPAMAQKPESPAAPAAASEVAAKNSPAADIVLGQISTATVLRGDSLWRISRNALGQGVRYTQIYEANAGQIRDPRLIYPGQVLVLPASP